MCYEFDSSSFRLRALEALRRKNKVADEAGTPAGAAKPARQPQETAAPVKPVAKPDTVPA